jgi:hypothetical protein
MPLLDEKQAASYLGVSPITLRSWRCRGIGPTFIKLGKASRAPVRYTDTDIAAFIAECRHESLVRVRES